MPSSWLVLCELTDITSCACVECEITPSSPHVQVCACSREREPCDRLVDMVGSWRCIWTEISYVISRRPSLSLLDQSPWIGVVVSEPIKPVNEQCNCYRDRQRLLYYKLSITHPMAVLHSEPFDVPTSKAACYNLIICLQNWYFYLLKYLILNRKSLYLNICVCVHVCE